jgi:G:T/U-mismatch repair DNA glycosylase
VRQDFLGFIDLLAISKADGIIGYQVCGSDYSSHRKKILVDRRDELQAWLEAGGRCVLIGWRKVKAKKGGVQMVWKPRIEEFTLESLTKEDDA